MAIRSVALIFDDTVRPDTTGVYCRRALEGLVSVQHFRPSELGQIPSQGFDLYLNIDDGLEYRLPPGLRPSAWWAIDTHLNLEWYLAKGPDFDLVFTAQRDGSGQLARGGISSARWLPLACDPEVHRKHALEKSFDFCFVGHLFPGPRSELIRLLQEHFPSHFVGQRFFEEMARTYSASRVVFNRSIRNDVNMRVFEALACGSVLVTNDLADNGLGELFQDGVHLATYQGAEELLDKVRFYLDHEEAREKVAAAGRTTVLARDTYRHRMESLLRQAERGLAGKTIPVRDTARRAAANAATGQPGAGANPLPPTRSQADQGDPWDEGFSAICSLMPSAAQRILVLGFGAARVKEALSSRQPTGIEALDFGKETPVDADRLVVDCLAGLSPHPYDVVICHHALEYLRDPLGLLKDLRTRLAPEGKVIVSVPTVRRQGVLRALLDGTWAFAPTGDPGSDPLRFFTRRGLEQLLYRAGFAAPKVQATPGPGNEDWVRRGRPGEVQAGGLRIARLAPREAEEFFSSRVVACAGVETACDHGLTSIVILTHNQLPFTRLCLESLRRYTDEPYELIVIDNGSTDGTVEYLRSLGGIRVVVNDRNVGFPVAANQGIRAAAGRQVLLLNNDTVVTTGWLARMLQALHGDPKVGLVGPCSNFVSGSQQVAVAYDLAGLEGFAWDRAQAHRGKVEDTDRLVGFCLLIRREVIEEVGLLDERFGVGCFEDDDYTRRALRAGYRAVVARDAFVHHFGGRTFLASGIDFAGLMARNRRLFEDKWEKVKAEAEKPMATQAGPRYTLRTGPGGGLRLARREVMLSLCMIVRDNARTLRACLESIRPWVDEMIVVDTGSQDETPEIARSLGARVFHFPWCDDFSAARNESVRHARGRWIFWMDSDDTIDPDNGRRLRELACREENPNVLGYVIQVHCPGPGEEGQADVTVVDHVKLFRNLPELRFEGRIHEQVLPAIRRLGGETAWTDLFVTHSGYDHSPEGQRRKRERDLRLLRLEHQERGEHPFTLFNLGMTCADVGQFPEAVGYLRRSIAQAGPGESHLRKAYALLVYSHAQLGQQEAAWSACQEGLALFPHDEELRFRHAILLHARGRLKEAAETYQDLLRGGTERHFTSVDRGILGFKARQNLAVVYGEMGEWALAEGQWQRVAGEQPRYRAGWRGLGEALLRQGKRDEAESLAGRLVQDPLLRPEGLLLKGQAAASRRDWIGARRALEQAAEAAPEDPEVLELLCRFLFERGDLLAAERHLLALVRCDPRSGAAHHNLGTVYLHTGRVEQAVAAFRESLRQRPGAVGTLVQLGHALRAGGHAREAVEAWQEALRFDPGEREALGALREAGPLSPGRATRPSSADG